MAQHRTHTHDHRHPGQPNPEDIRKALGGANYPATRDKLVESARNNGANQDIVDLVNHLPDKKYDRPAAVSKQISLTQ
jgi:hypothetical protein